VRKRRVSRPFGGINHHGTRDEVLDVLADGRVLVLAILGIHEAAKDDLLPQVGHPSVTGLLKEGERPIEEHKADAAE